MNIKHDNQRAVNLMDIQKNHAIPAGIFFIGLGLLFMTHHLFPGILLLFGIVAFAHAVNNGRNPRTMRAAWILTGLWLVLSLGFNLPFLMVAIGIGLLAMAYYRPAMLSEMRHKWMDESQSHHHFDHHYDWGEKLKNDLHADEPVTPGDVPQKPKSDIRYV